MFSDRKYTIAQTAKFQSYSPLHILPLNESNHMASVEVHIKLWLLWLLAGSVIRVA